MENRHASFDDQLAKIDASLRSGDELMARLDLARFDLNLSGYVRGEERAVFAALERRTGSCPPTTKMRKEHESLQNLVSVMWNALEHDDRHRVLDALETLRSLLVLHVAKEDWILYPMLEQH